ncbi:MAG TPA: S8 family serine peptidase [Acidimicrobiales bacterium]|nr:S8 family serine peptidase [Acidimicrobiales bacterium]
MRLRAPAPVVALAALAALVVGGVVPAATALEANEPALRDQQWGMQLIGAPDAWARGVTGKGITIAIVDTGVDLQHEDLAEKIVPGADFVEPNTPPQDDHGHGSHVAGIAAAVTGNGKGVTGVAPEAKIMPLKVLTSSGRGGGSPDDAIRFAVDNGAQVINLSIGSELDPLLGPSFARGIEYAWSKGVICVVAAGNSYVLSGEFSTVPALVVAATTRDERAASYSSGVGSAKWPMSAPGGEGRAENSIISTYWRAGSPHAYAYLSGTSMAAPHVAGAAALLRGAGLTPQQTVDRLLQTAKDLGPAGKDGTYGHGRLDVAKATAGLGSTPPAPPATTATVQPSPTAGTGPGASTPGRAPSTPPSPGPTAAPAPAQPTPAEPPAGDGEIAAADEPADTVPPDDAATTDDVSTGGAAESDDPVGEVATEPDDDSVSPLWPLVGALAVLGAAGGTAIALRRRNDRAA